MSVAELKRAVDGLTRDQRLELADYLRHCSKQEDPQWEAELANVWTGVWRAEATRRKKLLSLHERLSSA
jgi:hypothetical protein